MNRRINSGNQRGGKGTQGPVTEGCTRRDNANYTNNGNRRITTTSQGTGGTPPKQGK